MRNTNNFMFSFLIAGVLALAAGFGIIGSMSSDPHTIGNTEVGIGGAPPVNEFQKRDYDPLYGIGKLTPPVSITPTIFLRP